MMKILLIPLLALAGCASPGYENYLATQQSIAISRGDAERARYTALMGIAKQGDTAASVAAAMALALGGQQPQQHVEAPRNEFLQWASVLVPAPLTDIERP
jgi:hypothetical protein